MKKLLHLSILFILFSQSVNGQSVYELAFKFPFGNDSLTYTAFFTNHNDGTGSVRIKYRSDLSNDNKLVEMDIREEYADMSSDCVNKNRQYFKLQNPKYIGSEDSLVNFPSYFCFKLDTISGLFEPLGVSSSSDACKSAIVFFDSAKFFEQHDLTREVLLEYFNRQDKLYRNIFETRTKDLSIIERNIKLHLIVVANTNDLTIGPSCEKDMNRMVETFKNITDFLKIQFHSETIYGSIYNKQNVEKAIKSLAPNRNDIVVFYYSGHGFRKPNSRDTRYSPFIDLRVKNDNTIDQNSINMETIFNDIKAKGARLNLVLADCCNALLESSNNKGDAPAGKKGFSMNWSTQNCRDLFLKQTPGPVSILATAAEPGQLATSNNKFGGFFSYFFLTALENHFSVFKNNVSWKQVLTETRAQTKWKAQHTYCALPNNPKNICNQLPYVNSRFAGF